MKGALIAGGIFVVGCVVAAFVWVWPGGESAGGKAEDAPKDDKPAPAPAGTAGGTGAGSAAPGPAAVAA